MRRSFRELAIGAGALLLAGLVQPLLPDTITDIEPLALINHPVVQFFLLIVIAFYVLSTLLSWLKRLVRNPQRPFFTAVSQRQKPNHVDDEYELEKFGVKWIVLYGRRVIPGDRYAYAEDPRCPDCNTELMTDEKRRRIFSDRYLWRCPGCGYRQRRPSTWLHDEKAAVEKEIEAEARNQSQARNRAP